MRAERPPVCIDRNRHRLRRPTTARRQRIPGCRPSRRSLSVATTFNVCRPVQAVLIAEHSGRGPRAPEVDAAELLDAVEIDVRAAALGWRGRSTDLFPRNEADRVAGGRGDVLAPDQAAGRFLDREITSYSGRPSSTIPADVAFDDHFSAAVAANGHDPVAVGERLDGVAVFPKAFALAAACRWRAPIGAEMPDEDMFTVRRAQQTCGKRPSPLPYARLNARSGRRTWFPRSAHPARLPGEHLHRTS